RFTDREAECPRRYPRGGAGAGAGSTLRAARRRHPDQRTAASDDPGRSNVPSGRLRHSLPGTLDRRAGDSAMIAPDRPRISLLGTTALLFEAPGTFDLPHQQRIWALAAAASKWPGIREAIPGITNLMLTFATPRHAIDSLVSALRADWNAAREAAIEGRESE